MVFTLAVYYPGFMSFDSVYQLRLAREGVTDNGNPPMMSYVWRVVDRIIPGPGGMLILNAGIFWFSLAAIAATLFSSTPWRIAVLLFCGLWPPIFGLLGTIWKDVGMHAFFLGAIASTLHAQEKRRPVWLLLSGLFIWMASSYRHNAVVASVPLILLNVCIAARLLNNPTSRWARRLQPQRARGVFIALVTGLVCIILFSTVSAVNNYGVQDVQLWRAILIHDLVGISTCADANVLPEEITRQSRVDLRELKQIYVGHHLASIFNPGARALVGSADPTSTAVIQAGGVSGEVVFRRWFNAILDHPGCYLYHRGQIAAKLLVVEPGEPWYPFHVGIETNPYGITFTPSRLFQSVRGWLHFAATATFLYSAWIYHVLLIVFLLAAVILRLRYSGIVLAVAASGILYALTNLIMAGSGDFRYNNWLIGGCCLCLCFTAAGFQHSRPVCDAKGAAHWLRWRTRGPRRL
jgi:hypothetical protein